MNATDETGTEWRPVPGYEGLYEASNLGQVRRLADSPKCRKTRILRPNNMSSGYQSVMLCANGVRVRVHIHRLVMLAFCGPSDLQVNHKNGIKTDNRLVNLEYTTPSENMRHAFQTGLQVLSLGEENGCAKLTEEDVRQIRAMAANGNSKESIARCFHVSPASIKQILNGKTWRHVA